MAAGSITVLHVDDDTEITDLAANFLVREDEALTVETAAAAEAALERVGEGDVDCVVTDYRMDGVTDGTMLETLAAEYPSLPVIVFTGQTTDDIDDEVRAQVAATLQKRTGTEQYAALASAIREAVEGEGQ
jgi:DNA-binding NtrC family response regulator